MAGQQQQQQLQSGFGNQYPYSSSGQMRVPNYGQAQPDNDEYAQACSHVSQQLHAQIGDQRPAWDGQIPGFWDNRLPPSSSLSQQQQQQQQSHAMNQQNQLGRPATNFGQDQGQQYMGDDETSHFHAQEHFRASQLLKGGGGLGGGREVGGGHGGDANSGILPSAGMQQAPGQYNGQPYHNNNHQSTTMPGPNSFAAPRNQRGGHGDGANLGILPSAGMQQAPGQHNGQPYHNTNHQSATMPGPSSFAPRNQLGYAPSQFNAQMYPARTSRGGNM